MDPQSFLAEIDKRPLTVADARGLESVGLFLGRGPNALEVAVVQARRRPTTTDLRAAWHQRLGGRASPLLLVAFYDDQVAICGPAGDPLPVAHEISPSTAERICRAALSEQDRHAALRFLQSVVPEIESPLLGLRNEGLLATHELEEGVPRRRDWATATAKARTALQAQGRELLRTLGFTLEQTSGPLLILRAAGTRTALALLLERNEAPELPGPLFSGLSPIAHAMVRADEERVPYVLVLAGPMLRLYPARGNVGVGRRGRTETFVEARLDVLSQERGGYLWLLFSADALCQGGTFEEILRNSEDYAADLGERLRDRIYGEVIPDLATALAAAQRIEKLSATDLAQTYAMALTLLFRTLCIAYAEDKGLLPYRTNPRYSTRSLKQKARDLADVLTRGTPFDLSSTHWDELFRLFRAMDQGSAEWGVPPYNGGLFSSDPNVSSAGAGLNSVSLCNDVFAPVLANLLLHTTEDGSRVPVDFRSLSVREFGTIYEGLLESELSVAETDLTVDEEGAYRPVGRASELVTVRQGQVYLHNRAGARRATGSFFTKQFVVEYLLDRALEPTLQEHLTRLNDLDDRTAGDSLFDFRVADIAMGSGHFLVAAVDRVERAFSKYLADRRLSGVVAELDRLRITARESLQSPGDGMEIDEAQLLRRQIARRCVYGVDLNPLAVELAKLSLWIHTFVPGLPLSFLDSNLVVGDSLIGSATIQEAQNLLRELSPGSLFAVSADRLIGSAREAINQLARLSDATAAEIATAREAVRRAQDAVASAAALLDILTAAKLDRRLEREVAEHASHWVDDLTTVPESGAHAMALKLLEETPPLHFPIRFPGVFLRPRSGFDVIVGNPPWEKIRVEEHEFWARHAPGLRGQRRADRDRHVARLRKERPDLVALWKQERARSEKVRDVIRDLPGMDTGHPDLFRAFTWRFIQLVVQAGGRFSVVLPGDAFKIAGGADVRERLASACSDIWLQMLTNKGGWVFDDVHPQKLIALAAAVVDHTREHVSFRLAPEFHDRNAWDGRDPGESVVMPLEMVQNFSRTLIVPLLPRAESLELIEEFMRFPALLSHPTLRLRRVYADFETSKKDRRYWHATKAQGDWPVYAGESFDIWEPDTGRYYAFTSGTVILKAAHAKWRRAPRTSPYASLPAEWRAHLENHPINFPRIAFRDVTNRTNTRTFIAALIPARVVTVQTAPWILWLDPTHPKEQEAYLLGVLCSLPLDWWCRRFIEGHADQEAFNSLRIPDPRRDSKLTKRVVQLAGCLAAQGARFARWADEIGVKCTPLTPEERQDKIHELDAVVAHLYGLTEQQLQHIFDTFHEGWDYEEHLRATLAYYNILKRKL